MTVILEKWYIIFLFNVKYRISYLQNITKMPVDTRRIQGPESSTDYRAYVKKKAKDPKTPVDKRPDGRSLNDPRRIFLKTGVITKAKGSSYIEQGQTKLMVGVI